MRVPPIRATRRAGQHQAPMRAGILRSIERTDTMREFLSSLAIFGFYNVRTSANHGLTGGGAEDQFPLAHPPAAGAEAVAGAAAAGVGFLRRGDCTWNLFPAAGDVGFLRRGDFTWKGEATFTAAIIPEELC